MKATVYYRKPDNTGKVRDRKDVGRTNTGYASYASLDPDMVGTVGYGSGETPELARKDAHSDLMRRLSR